MWQLALALGLLQQLNAPPASPTATAIVVERNMFAYYKVPAAQLLLDTEETSSSSSGSSSDSKKFKSDLYFVLQCPPKLDTGIPKPKDMQTCSVVDQYKGMWKKPSPPQPKKHLHMVPFRIVMRPLRPPAMRRTYRRRKRHQNSDQEDDEEESTPLQHLGQPHIRQKLLKLKADHRKFKRGSSSQGYQHMYHRDESYNDHIFYDDLQADGQYHKYGKQIQSE
ncbi:uncharacterized protein [Drosophila pseudoobscura]|uniref:Uncharacterized protein n=1 Tax=Drosophila pseudoobscura pseudoobscura TaxID=46245 RepID=A0A6I8VPQ2_DROPS|nr:uncharacterized protein LOC4803304 [Drosophila pseudoobscura]